MDPMRQLVGILESQIAEADGLAGDVTAQRERNHENYTLQPLGNERPGRSRYISPDVLDSVEAKKAIFIETFFSGRQIVKFKADGYTSREEADVKTAYAMAQLRRNRHFRLFRDGWHDAFVAKRMVLWADWKPATERVTVELDNTPAEAAMLLLQRATAGEKVLDIDDSQIQQAMGPQGPVASGPVTAIVDRGHVEIQLIQPERYRRDPHATYVEDASWAAFDKDFSRGELVEMGFDPAQVMELKSDYRYRGSAEDSARKRHDGSSAATRRTTRVREQEQVTVFRHYAWLDAQTVLGDMRPGQLVSGIDLFEVLWAGGDVLRWADGSPAIRVVDEMPFFEWCEYKISHAEHGMADADVLDHTQRVNSILKRLILDNQQMRNTSRYEALYGAVKNPRDLMDQKIGGVVWTNRVGAVKPLDTPDLSPMIMPVLQMLKADAESRSGVTDLAKGMNTDVVKYQNAADMIERLTNASNRRIMKAARDFAETLLIPLVQHIVKLGRRHDGRLHILQVGGYPVQVQPQQWMDVDSECEVDVSLTASAGQQHAQMLLSLHQIISQDPQLGMLYQLPQRHALFDTVFDAIGHSNSTQFLMRPDDPQFMQQMQQAQQKQAQMEQMQQMMLQLQMAAQQKQVEKVDVEKVATVESVKIAKQKFQLEAADKAADNMRADKQFEWERLTDVAELKLEQEQKRAAKIGDGKMPEIKS